MSTSLEKANLVVNEIFPGHELLDYSITTLPSYEMVVGYFSICPSGLTGSAHDFKKTRVYLRCSEWSTNPLRGPIPVFCIFPVDLLKEDEKVNDKLTDVLSRIDGILTEDFQQFKERKFEIDATWKKEPSHGK